MIAHIVPLVYQKGQPPTHTVMAFFVFFNSSLTLAVKFTLYTWWNVWLCSGNCTTMLQYFQQFSSLPGTIYCGKVNFDWKKTTPTLTCLALCPQWTVAWVALKLRIPVLKGLIFIILNLLKQHQINKKSTVINIKGGAWADYSFPVRWMSQQLHATSGVCWQCIWMNCDSFVQQ